MPTARHCFLLITLLAATLIAIALFMEYQMGLEPCYMCMLQRVFLIAAGGFALLAFLFNPAHIGQRLLGGLVAISALFGAFFAGKQLWLQSLPEDQIPECGLAVGYLFEVHSFTAAVAELLKGDGHCAEVQWTFLGLSIPGWTLIFFVGIAALAIWQVLRARKISD